MLVSLVALRFGPSRCTYAAVTNCHQSEPLAVATTRGDRDRVNERMHVNVSRVTDSRVDHLPEESSLSFYFFLSLSLSLSFLLCTSSLNRNREPLFVFAIERKASFNSGYFDSQARKINEFSEIIVKVWWFWWLVYSLSCLWVCCIVVTFIEVWSVNELSKNFIVDFCRSHCDVCVVKKYVFVLVRICFFFNPCQFPLFECMKWSWSGNNHAVTQKYVESRVVVVI